ncbi:MAG: monofunctional biosynthetic peptidoglycan transglycosylase [Bacteroidota bacterium]
MAVKPLNNLKSAKSSKPVAKKKTSGASRFKVRFSKFIKFVKYAALIFFILSIFSVIFFRFVNPPFTPLMVIRAVQMKFDGKEMKIDKTWKPIEEISPKIIIAIMTSEDQNFKEHFGFDFKAIQKAAAHNAKENVRVVKGASTISQQTAKNVFLWPHRDWVRKGLEAYFTLLIEVFWSKERIMEVYLNVIEFGNGVYGIEAASEYYYHKPAKDLTNAEAAAIAAVVPAPRKWSPIKKSPKVARHSQWILNNMGKTGPVKF